MHEESIASGISRILWFFYRVVFTLIPSTVFLFMIVFFLKYNFNGNALLDRISYVYEKTPVGIAALITIIIIGFINIFIEAIVLKLTYRWLGFNKRSSDMHHSFRDDTFSKFFKDIRAPFSIYNVMQIKALKEGNKIFEHIEYYLTREFLFNNTWILLLIGQTFFLPFTLNNLFGHKQHHIGWVVLIEFTFSCFFLLCSSKFIKPCADEEGYDHFGVNKNRNDTEDDIDIKIKIKILFYLLFGIFKNQIKNNKQYKLNIQKGKAILYSYVIISISIILLLALPSYGRIVNNIHNHHYFTFWCVLIGINCSVFMMCYFLMVAGFREYVNVDKIVHAYYLIEIKEFESIGSDKKNEISGNV